MLATLDIITVNWNSGSQLRTCLQSVASASRSNFKLQQYYVVDNNSADGSANDLDLPELPVKTIFNRENLGFGAACNQAIRLSQADYILLLNPDTRLNPDSLECALGFLQAPQNAHIGILGIQLIDDRGQIKRSCARFPRPANFFAQLSGLDQLAAEIFPGILMRDWDHRSSRPVDHVMGSFYLARRGVFESAGLFDEHFFMYLEDLDLSWRAHQAGWQSYYLAESQAYHRFGGTSEQVIARRLYYFLSSRVRYAYKHFTRPAAVAHLAATLLIEPFTRLVHAGLQGQLSTGAEILRAYALLWKSLPDLTKTPPPT